MTDAELPVATRINRPAVAICFSLGLMVTGMAFVVGQSLGVSAVAVAVIVNLGTAFLLAGVLYVIERRFTVRVQQTAATEAAKVAKEETRDLRDRTVTLEIGLDELRNATTAFVRKRDNEFSTLVASIETISGFDPIWTALERAAEDQMTHSELVVDGTDTAGAVPVSFMSNWDTRDGAQDEVPIIEVALQKGDDTIDTRRHGLVWWPDEGAVEFGGRLIEHARQQNIPTGEHGFDFSATLARLRIALDASQARHTQAPENWLEGVPWEFIGEWAITSAGLEHRTHPLVVPMADVPNALVTSLADRVPGITLPTFPPEPPGWMNDHVLWRQLCKRLRWRAPSGFGTS